MHRKAIWGRIRSFSFLGGLVLWWRVNFEMSKADIMFALSLGLQLATDRTQALSY